MLYFNTNVGATLKTASAADARFTHVAALSFLSSSTPYKVLTRKKVARPPSPSRKPKRW